MRCGWKPIGKACNIIQKLPKNPNLCIETTPTQLSKIVIVWLISFPNVLQLITFHADRSSVDKRACGKMGNDTLKNFSNFHRF